MDHQIEQIIEGNHLEFSRFIDTWSQELFLFARGLLGNSEMAEEVVSDVFLSIWQQRHRLSEIANIKSYLYVSVRNKSLSTLSKKQLTIVSLDDLPGYYVDEITSPNKDVINPDLMEEINIVIENLPPKTKMAFSLSKIQGLKNKEVAETMNMSVKNVEYHLKQAIIKISEALDSQGIRTKKQKNQILSVLFSLTL
jgi:RNA polymerase sigma-70 factor (ECF subfamily)